MSSCMSPVPYAFQAGGVCAGMGTCVNSTRTPGLLLCKCFPGYSGASDFFDNRVEKLDDGTWLSYSCNQSNTGTYVVWSLFCLCSIVRMIQIAPVWLHFYRKHYADPAKVVEGVWKDAPLRIVSLDLVVLSTLHLTTGLCKLAGMTFGTDVLPTLTLCVTVFLFQLVIFDLTKTEFDIFVKGSANPAEAERAKRFRNFLKCCTLATFFLCNPVASFWTLSVDKSKGPLINGGNFEEISIYFRNIGSIAFGLGELWSTWMIRKRVTALRQFQSGNMDAISYIIKKMDGEMKQYLIFSGTLGVTYAVFSLPFLLPYQTYIVAFIVMIGSLRHSGKAFASEKEAKRKTTAAAAVTSGDRAGSVGGTESSRKDRVSQVIDEHRRKMSFRTNKTQTHSGERPDSNSGGAYNNNSAENSKSNPAEKPASEKRGGGGGGATAININIDYAEGSLEPVSSNNVADPKMLNIGGKFKNNSSNNNSSNNNNLESEATELTRQNSNNSFADNDLSPRSSEVALNPENWTLVEGADMQEPIGITKRQEEEEDHQMKAQEEEEQHLELVVTPEKQET